MKFNKGDRFTAGMVGFQVTAKDGRWLDVVRVARRNHEWHVVGEPERMSADLLKLLLDQTGMKGKGARAALRAAAMRGKGRGDA